MLTAHGNPPLAVDDRSSQFSVGISRPWKTPKQNPSSPAQRNRQSLERKPRLSLRDERCKLVPLPSPPGDWSRPPHDRPAERLPARTAGPRIRKSRSLPTLADLRFLFRVERPLLPHKPAHPRVRRPAPTRMADAERAASRAEPLRKIIASSASVHGFVESKLQFSCCPST
jgi:hypothetical protein